MPSQTPPVIDYAESRRNGRGGAAALWVLGVALVLLPVLVWGLFELQRAPYRPPVDTSTLLGESEIRAVRGVIGVLCLLWCACGIALAVAIRRRTIQGESRLP